MKAVINEYIFYTIQCILLSILSIYLSFSFHNGSILFVFLYGLSLSALTTEVADILHSIFNKKPVQEEPYVE